MRYSSLLVLCLAVAACGSTTASSSDAGDAGTTADAGTTFDGGTIADGGMDGGVDGGTVSDGGTSADGGTAPDGGPAGTAMVNGSVGGVMLAPVDAVTSLTDVMNTNAGVTIDISDVANECADLQANRVPKNATALEITLQSSGLVMPGTYPIGTAGAGNLATATFAKLDAQCMPAGGNPQMATSGNVVVTSVATQAGQTTQGTFQLSFGTDMLDGTFQAPFCGTTNMPMTPTCQ